MSNNLTIGDVCNITTGKLDSNAFVEDGQFPFYTCSKDPLQIDTYAFDDDVILVAGNNAQGNFHLNRYNGKFNAYQRTYILTSKDNQSLNYIYYLLKLALKSLKGKSQGSQTKFLTMGILENVNVPNLNNKNRVAKVLSDLDAKIELNNKINEELEAMAKTLYDYWFVQFDFPDANGKPYKSSGGKMVYNDQLKLEIPNGWKVKKLKNFAFIKKGTLITEKTADTNGKIKVVSAGVGFSYFHSKSNYKSNTITVSASGANAGFINFWREPIYACDCTTVRGRCDSETFVILEFLKMRQAYLYKQARGSAQPHVYPKDVEILDICIPNPAILDSFGKFTICSNSQIAKNIKEKQELTELRDWLLPMLMNGQVTIQEAIQEPRMAAEAISEYQ